MSKAWLDHDKLSATAAAMGAKLKAQASATVRELVDTNAVERGVATTTTRADDAMDADPRARELTELTELLQAKDEELMALKDALRRVAEDGGGGGGGATRRDAALATGAVEGYEKEMKKLRDGKAWAEEEAKAFEKECDEARAEASEATRKLEALEKELERAQKGERVESEARTPSDGNGDDNAASREALESMTKERDDAVEKAQSMKTVNDCVSFTPF